MQMKNHNYAPQRFLRGLGLVTLALGLNTLDAHAVTTYTALVLRVTLTDSVPSKTAAQLNDIFFTNSKSVKKFYEDSSYGQATWTGTVLDVSIPYSTTDGSTGDTWCDAAEQAARAKGYEPNNYTAKVDLFDSGGGGGATSENGGTSRVQWYNYSNWGGVNHEMGHAIGFDHAGKDVPGQPFDAYGDESDNMGGSGYFTNNAPHKVQKGWLTPTRITANGTFTVAALEASSGTRAFLYVPKNGDAFYFSYRRPLGFDAATTQADGTPKPAIGAPFTTGLNIHQFAGSGATHQVRYPLTDGESYTLPGTAIVIKQTGHNSAGTTFTLAGINSGETYTFTGAGTYRLAPYAAPDSALNSPGFATANGTQLIIYNWGGGTNEKFNFVSLGNGLYKIQCVYNTTKVITASGTGDGAAVTISNDVGSNAQKWQIVDVGGGYYSLKPQNVTTKAVDNSTGSADDNNPQVLWPFSADSFNQRWKFIKQ